MKSPKTACDPIVVSRAATLDSRRAAWGRLLAQSPADTIFLTWEWQSRWWELLGAPSGAELHLLECRSGDDLVGLAPLVALGPSDAASAQLHFAGGEEIADFLDVLALPGQEAEVADALLDHLLARGWPALELRNLRRDAFALAHLAPAARARDLVVEVEQEDVSPWLKLPASWDAYLEGLTKKDRHELRRKLRRLHAAGNVRWYVAADPARRRQDVADFIRLHRLSAEVKAAFMTAEMEAWFLALVEQFAPAGQLKLYFLELDGLRVASAICFDYHDQVLLYNSGYDPEHARLSVGLALKAYCIHDAIAAQRQVFDFLQGDEPYKYDLGAVDAPIYRLRVRRA